MFTQRLPIHRVEHDVVLKLSDFSSIRAGLLSSIVFRDPSWADMPSRDWCMAERSSDQPIARVNPKGSHHINRDSVFGIVPPRQAGLLSLGQPSARACG